MVGAHLEDDARSVLRLVDTDPRRAARLAVRLVRAAVRANDPVAGAVAGRAAGLAALHLSRADTAVRQLDAALACAERSSSPALVAETRMSLAFALTRHGRVERALATVTAALAGLTGLPRARALAQRGAIQQQLERLEAALVDYRAALPVLRDAGDWVWVQRIYCNRAVLHVYRSQLTAAESELLQAQQLCVAHGLDLQLAFVTENLAFLQMRSGDVLAAIRALDEAERQHAALGASTGTVLLDRTELLLSVGLASEAREAAGAALAELTRTRRLSARPQALLLLGEACLLDGDVPAARRAAASAAAAAARQHRVEWAALARQLTIRCQVAAPGRSMPSVAAVALLASTLEDNGLTLPALDTRLLAARVALQHGDVEQARAHLHRPGFNRRRGPVEPRVRAWHAEALLRLAEGSPRRALRALGAGVRLVEEHQATLGATDLRSAVSSHRAEVVGLGLELSLGVGRARDVLTWAERGRATTLLTRPVRPPDDPVLAQRLVELRGAVADVEAAHRAGRRAESLLRTQALRERAVRDQARRTSGPGSRVSRPPVEVLVAALGDLALVEYVEHDGSVWAVTAVAGRVRLWPLGAVTDVVRLLVHLPLVLRRLARGSGPARSTLAAMGLFTELGRSLEKALLTPMLRELGDRPLVVVPSGSLQCLPWGLLPACLGRPVTVSPSAALWHSASVRPARPGRVLAVAGPGLPAAGTEVEAVASAYPDVHVLTGRAATVQGVSAALPHASTGHFAVHGQFRADNPLFSQLALDDGPLTVYDLEALERVPDLVVLAACDSARSGTCYGGEVLGLAAAFLTLGTLTLVSSLVPIVDLDSVPLMTHLHAQLRNGVTPAVALAGLQRDLAQDGTPAQYAAAAGLICLGADRGTPRLPRQGSRLHPGRGHLLHR